MAPMPQDQRLRRAGGSAWGEHGRGEREGSPHMPGSSSCLWSRGGAWGKSLFRPGLCFPIRERRSPIPLPDQGSTLQEPAGSQALGLIKTQRLN